MKHSLFLYFLFFLLIVSCAKKKQLEKTIEFSKKEVKEVVAENRNYEEIDSSVLNIDSIVVENKTFKIICLDNDFWKDKENPSCNLLIINYKNDTIFKSEEFTNCFEIKDFNEDGYKDVEINYFTNVPGINDMLLYDNASNNFKLIENFQDFPSSQKIKGTDFYYSYHRSGCADINWDSDLFYIKNFKCYRIGNISGRGCKDEERNGIIINKVKNEQEIELEYIKRKAGYYDDKWDFIENYWLKNHKKFIN